MTKFQKTLAAAASLLAVSPASALATTISINPTGNFATLNTITVSGIISFIISAVFIVAGIGSFIFLLVGGVQWILAGGDKEGTEKARKRITAALVGLAIVFSAYALTILVQTIFGVSITEFTVPVITN